MGKPIETRLRVMSWNLWWRFGPWEARARLILDELRDSRADVIALQEVWEDAATNQAAILARELGFHHAYVKAMDMGNLGFGNAILSRWPIVRQRSLRLYAPEGAFERRAALLAEIDGPRGPLGVVSTHLNYRGEDSHIRQRQVADMARFIADNRPKRFPPVLCGDFNAEPDSDEIRMLRGLTTCPVEGLFFHDAWAVAGDGGAGATWDNRNGFAAPECEPDRRIDYILVGAPGPGKAGHVTACRLAGTDSTEGLWPSDHFAVVADLRY